MGQEVKAAGWASPRFLPSSLALRSDEVDRMRSFQSREVANTTFYTDPAHPPRAQVCGMGSRGIRLFYSEVEGTIVRHAATSGLELSVGIVLAGQATVLTSYSRVDLEMGDAVLTLPGDATLQRTTDMDALTLRLAVDDATLFRLRALPYSHQTQIPRKLERRDSLDLSRLMQFVALEHERAVSCGDSSECLQVQVLLEALRSRLLGVLAWKTGFSDSPDPEKIRICLEVDRLFWKSEASRHSAADLAYQAACSTRQLYRAFAEVAGVSPLEYQNRVRLQMARGTLLESVEEHVGEAELAKRYGFASRAQFVCRYRSEFGEAPEDTRANHISLLRAFLKDQFGGKTIPKPPSMPRPTR